MSFVTWFCLPGVYKIPNAETELLSAITNKCPWNAYRGFGKDAAAFVMDRIVDEVAKATGLETTEVRFRNFIPPEEFPYPQVSGAMLDSGNYAGALANSSRSWTTRTSRSRRRHGARAVTSASASDRS